MVKEHDTLLLCRYSSRAVPLGISKAEEKSAPPKEKTEVNLWAMMGPFHWVNWGDCPASTLRSPSYSCFQAQSENIPWSLIPSHDSDTIIVLPSLQSQPTKKFDGGSGPDPRALKHLSLLRFASTTLHGTRLGILSTDPKWLARSWKLGSQLALPSSFPRPWSQRFGSLNSARYGSVSKPCTPVVHIKIAGKWMFIPLKMVCIGIDPYPYKDEGRSSG